MFVRADGDRVAVEWSLDDAVEVHIARLTEWDEAARDYRAHVTELSTVELRPFTERLNAAQSDLDDLFTDRLTIEQAERLHARLFKAITEAKVNAGRFNP